MNLASGSPVPDESVPLGVPRTYTVTGGSFAWSTGSSGRPHQQPEGGRGMLLTERASEARH